MLTGMYAVRNLLLGQTNDLWAVNADDEYHEEVRDPRAQGTAAGRNARRLTLSDAVTALDNPVVREELSLVFARIDKLALGIANAVVCGVTLAVVTLIVWLRDGDGMFLPLLSNFYPGYRVSPTGSLLGLQYGLITGFVLGWTLAALRNVVMFISWAFVRHRAERGLLGRMLEFV